MEIWARKPEERPGLTRRTALSGGLALTLAGCNSMGVELPPVGQSPAAVHALPGAPLVSETLGAGRVRVGMILPLTQNGGAKPRSGLDAQRRANGYRRFRRSLHHADDLGRPFEFRRRGPSRSIGTHRGGGTYPRAGVRQRRAGGGGGDKMAGRPMIAFSTDVSVAAPGVYLLSFLIESYADRIIQYAVSTGKKSFAIMAPQTDYGNVAAARFQQDAANIDAQVVVSARYSAGQPANAAQEIAAVAGQIDALFIPEQADGMPSVASSLATNNVKTQYLGTGVWNDARVLKLPQCRAPGSPRRTIPVSTPSFSATKPNLTANRPGWRRWPMTR